MLFFGRIRKSFLLRICVLLAFVSLLWFHVGLFIYRGAEIDYENRFKNGTVVLPNHPNYSNIELARPTNLTTRELMERVSAENAAQAIYSNPQISWPPVNETEFWPNGIVITIQVHNRISYLRKLLQSLSQARWIDRALLIFSHNIYSEELNAMIRSIPFAAVMQIHFPYSTQLYPSSFPGDSPLDCPRDITREKAKTIGCTNADSPDLYGHYREARYSQTKHHWWWKTNFIFGRIDVLRDYEGPVLFMEEDHFVAEDFLHVLWLQQQLVNDATKCSFCQKVRILSLGSYPKLFNHREASDMVDLVPWSSSRHNMGMAFNRTVWKSFQLCSNLFCSVDDYNWDWSLFHVAQHCLPAHLSDRAKKDGKFVLETLVLKGPRVFHIGECGVHHRKASCASDTSTLRRAEASLQSARKAGTLFPVSLRVKSQLTSKVIRLKKGNGGWGDPRDKELCLSLTVAASS